ncbi:MAG: hypothetical protein K9J12_13075 [Melioribacteraceae bacterium]|nr:hypothetical protein [Melioribacteraceae bacterium]MCF8264399.1 hypothetical protein [Melioribacteraceae bacterium]MCF8414418.1 hypothetical protein [Melioribacteraceae bacterium]
MSENFQIRPRFKLETALPPEEIIAKIKTGFSLNNSSITGWVSDRTAHVEVAEHKTIWSPQLTIYAEEIENGSELRCVIGPNSTVWTTIIFFYAILGMSALLGLMWGASQMTVGQTPLAFWLIPIAIILSSGVFFGAKVGQKLSAGQMVILREFIIKLSGSEPDEIR